MSCQLSLGSIWAWPGPRTMENNQSTRRVDSGPLSPNKTSLWCLLFLEAGMGGLPCSFPVTSLAPFQLSSPSPSNLHFVEICMWSQQTSRRTGESPEAGGKRDPFHFSLRILAQGKDTCCKKRIPSPVPISTPTPHLLILPIPGRPVTVPKTSSKTEHLGKS